MIDKFAGGAALKPTPLISSIRIVENEDTRTSFSTNFVIEFARARVGHINAWLGRQLEAIRNSGRDSQVLNDLLASLAQHSEGFDDAESHKKCKQALKRAIDELPSGSPIRAQLASLRDDDGSPLNDNNEGGRDTKVSKADMAAIIKEVENKLKSVDRGSQESQLMINSKIAEKNEVLQLAAMIIQQIHACISGIQQRS
ncbi:MAG: hypothetical protein KF795_13455 [Labilithrix sp.]|nr:hypothetical protein [Labilithrix sp.]